MEKHITKQTYYKSNKSKAFAIIIGQCTTILRYKLEAKSDWNTIEDDPVAALIAIKDAANNFQDTKYHIATVHKSLKDFFTIKQ